jgi:hypothetical protein
MLNKRRKKENTMPIRKGKIYRDKDETGRQIGNIINKGISGATQAITMANQLDAGEYAQSTKASREYMTDTYVSNVKRPR